MATFNEADPIQCQACGAKWPDNAAFCAAQERRDVCDNECPSCGGTAFNYTGV